MTIADLDEFARLQWEGVLSYMVGSTGIGLSNDGVELSQGVQTLLKIGKLVEVRGRSAEITKDGFAFILQEVNAQVWTILILYLQNAEAVCCPSIPCVAVLMLLAQYGRSQHPVFPIHARLP